MTQCVLCDSTDGVEMHHVKPKSQGGAKVKPLCHRCHGHIHGFNKKMSTSYLTRRAIRHKKAQGKHIGSPPFGFDMVDGVLVENRELETVKRIIDLRLAGETLQAIADNLNADDVPTKRGGRWYPTTVSKIINRENNEWPTP